MVAAAAVTAALSLTVASPALAGGTSGWTTGGYDLANSRNNSKERVLNAANVAGLHAKWAFTTGGDVSATPAVDDNLVFFPDTAGSVYAVNKVTGALVWRTSVAAVTGIPGDYARDTPAVSGSVLILGDQGGKFGTPDNPTGAYVFALDIKTGALVWKNHVETEFTAIVTQSAQVKGGVAYIGVASNAEAYASSVFNQGTYTCCTFRGSMLALDTRTGATLWKTYLAPAGFSGAGVWGSTPSVDAKRRMVYVATGNNYSAPPDTITCLQNNPTAPDTCLPADDMFDSIVALNMDTGAVAWSTRGLSSDVWNLDCGLGFPPFDTVGPNCPAGVAGPDYDFGQAPTLMTVKSGKHRVDVVGDGQKSGVYWMLDRSTGAVIWKTQVGPGGTLGGAEWGSAQDGTRIYVSNANSGDLTQPGFWAALNPATGQVVWQLNDPAWAGPYSGYSAVGAVSSANGVVYACTMNALGTMFAIDAATGAVRWSFDSGGSCNAGAAISGGTVYWGSGYRVLGTPNNKLYAFGL